MKTKDMVLAAVFAAVTVICSQIIIPLPLSPVPISLSVLGVFLTGAVLGKKPAAYAQLVYILIGAVGLPVFAGFKGGIGHVIGPTGGYLIAYPLMAFCEAWIIEKLGKNRVYAYLPGMLAGLFICYALGSLWLSVQAGISIVKALMLGVVPFIILDLVKIIISAALAFIINKSLSARRT